MAGLSLEGGCKSHSRFIPSDHSESDTYLDRPWHTGHISWHEYATSGHIRGFVWYTRTRHYRDDPHKEPTICCNETDSDGTHSKWFICPSEDLTSNYKYCCGQEDNQYCCRVWEDWRRVLGLPLFILILIIIGSAIKKKKIRETTCFQRMFNKKISTRTDESVQLNPLEMPGQPQSELAPQFQPELPPEYPSQFQPAREYPAQLQPAPMYPLQPQPMPQPEFPISNSDYMPGMPPAGPGMSTGVSGIPPSSVEGPALAPPCTPFHTLPTLPCYSHCITSLDSKPLDPFYPHTSQLPSDSPYPIGPISSVPSYPSCPPPPYSQL